MVSRHCREERAAMAADRGASLRAAAARKRELATSRAQTALRELDQRGAEITFQSVARHAGVSRQWLYEQPDLRREIDRLRAGTRGRAAGIKASERASDASLRQRLSTLTAENRRLREENQALKTELALAYGVRRDAATAPGQVTQCRPTSRCRN